MTRAAPLSPDDRRRALIAATRPLLAEFGPDVSTRRIAEAAGVAEGTIFRVFETKQDLIQAVIIDSVSPDALVAAIESVPETDDLATLVRDLLTVLRDDMEKNRTLFSLINRPEIVAHMHACKTSRAERGKVTGIALAKRLAPFADQLNLPLPKAALVVASMAFVASPMLPSSVVFDDLDDLTNVLLHGISKG
ncbi:MAG: TetR/AcrR family transcriptional regulator [Micropruina sp.]|nr:TetR/AcrR family transcriptional regulator [Micropruina sp.]